MCLVVLLYIGWCYRGRTELSSDNPVITLSISSLTAATVGSGCQRG